MTDLAHNHSETTGITETLINGRQAAVRFRGRFGQTLSLIGFLIFLIGIKPALFGLDRSISIGFVQILTLLFGLGLLSWGANIVLSIFWTNTPKTLLADFGKRTVATGYVMCVFTALADAFGFGTNPLPNVFLGTLQSRGLMIGMGIIAIGLLMQVRYRRKPGE